MSCGQAALAVALLAIALAAYLSLPALNSGHRGILPAGAGLFHGPGPGSSSSSSSSTDRGSQREILVMYIFSSTDGEFLDNLRFFVREAVEGDERCDYVFVVQHDRSRTHLEQALHLPALPAHARYVHHSNECYDWGTFGWLLQSGKVHFRHYTYFFFINCSVRGPYLPVYARGRVHWTQPFLSRLNAEVKLVGPTISCEGSPLDGKVQGLWRRNPHVQSYAMATDRVGLKLLLNDGRVFRCQADRWSAIYHSELGSSAAVLAAGYNIDCFMARYQGVDWRQHANWECNGGASPQGEHMSDGLTLSPLEVMFVKLKSYSLMNGVSSATTALKYQQWMHPAGPASQTCAPRSSALDFGSCPQPSEEGGEREGACAGAEVAEPDEVGAGGGACRRGAAEPPPGASALGDVTSNEYLSDVPRFKVPRVLEAKARGPACFDFDFYVERNRDLRRFRARSSTTALWKHYVYFGQFELRQYRFSCPFDYERFMVDPELPTAAPPP